MLFTATPFRRDEQEIKGEPVYAYPIGEAVKEGILSKIDFVPVIVPVQEAEGEGESTERNDRAIAREVEAIFRRDRADGFEHLIMVRTDERSRAEVLAAVYADETALRLEVIHSEKGTRAVDQTIKNLRGGTIDGIICVDMLGEGFDLPKLKIAGIHAPHKSLSATLQFIGRFARSGPDNLGPATFLAIPNDIALQSVELYEESASWQDVIPGLLEQGVQDVVRTKKVLSGYKRLTDDRDNDAADEVSLFALRPYSHVRVYNAVSEVKLGNTIDFGSAVSIQHRWISPASAVLITKEQRQPKWTTLDIFPEVTHELIVIYVSVDRKYLFICSSYRDSDGLYEQIAEQLCPGGAYPVSEDTAKKALLGLKEQEQFMVGLRNSLHRSRAETYRMVTGRTVNRAIQPADGQSYTLGHSFGTALDDGKPVTIGWSGTGKIWSNTSHRIPDLIDWCERLACRFASPDEVLTESELDFFRTGKAITTIPIGVISAEWEEEVYSQPMYIRYVDSAGNARQTDLTNTDLEIDQDLTTTTAAHIRLVAPNIVLPIEFRLDRGNWFSLPNGDPYRIEILRGRQELSLLTYLNDHPPMLYFWDFSSLIRDTYYPTPPSSWAPFLPEWIEVVDWDERNVDVTSEVAPGRGGKLSVHEYTEAHARAEGCNLITVDTLLKIALSSGHDRLQRWGREADGVAEALEATHQPLLHALSLQLVEIRDAALVVGLPPGQEVVDDHQDGVPEGDERALLTPPGGDAAILGGEVGVLGLARDVGDLDERLAQRLVALARLAAQAFAAALGVARAHPRPGGAVLGIREAAQIGPELGEQHLGGARAAARHRVEQRDRRQILPQARGDRGADPLHRLLQVVEMAQVLGEQEGVVVGEAPHDRAGQFRPLGPQAAARQIGESGRVGRPGEQRLQDGARRDAAYVGHDRRQLDIGVLEHRLEAVGQARALLDQVRAIARQVAQVALRRRGDEAAADQPVAQQVGNPLRVFHLRLPPRDGLNVVRVRH